MKTVLMIAYHFPPIHGSSGVQRTLRFARYLPECGWRPIVLTVHPRAYEKIADDQLKDIPQGVKVLRTQAWDTARHFALAGRYPGFLARPDRWISWWLSAVPAGLHAIRKYRPDALWSTYPIATAHRIGASLHARTKLPWIADFRDPMAQDDYPRDPATWKSFSRIERTCIEQASISTFTTPSALDTYRSRYPEFENRLHLLENGYDEETFQSAAPQSTDGEPSPLNPGCITLLHSGIVYPSERDPTHLFKALHQIKVHHPESYARLRIRFRAAVHDDLLRQLAEENDVSSAIEIMPPVGYRDALAEMLQADGLLILQASNCNAQIPAKLYEYLRTRRPIISLTDTEGDTARTCRAAGLSAIAPLNQTTAICDLLVRFLSNSHPGFKPTEDAIRQASRQGRTEQLAQLLEVACKTKI